MYETRCVKRNAFHRSTVPRILLGMNEPPAHAFRPAYAWYVVGVLTLANVSGFVDRQILGVLVPSIKRDFGITDAQMSYLGAAFSLFFAVMGLPIARLAEHFGRRSVMATGVALWSIFTALCATATTYGRLFAMRIGVGVGEASLNAPSVSLIADYFPRERLGRAMGVYQLGVFLGSGVGYFLGGWIVELARVQEAWTVPIIGAIRPWQSAFLVAGLPGLLIALLFFTIREPRRAHTRTAEDASFRAVFQHVGAHRKTFLTHGLGFSLFAMVNFGLGFWIPTFFQRTYGWDAAAASRVQGLLTMSIGVVGVLLGGWLTDWFARRGHSDAPIRVGILGALGMLISATTFSLMPTARLAIICLAVVNLFAASPWGAAGAALAQMSPPRLRGQSSALFYFALSIVGGMFGPIVIAWFTDHVFTEAGIRHSLTTVIALGMSISVLSLAAGLASFRKTVDANSGTSSAHT
jgi:MFS family permease